MGQERSERRSDGIGGNCEVPVGCPQAMVPTLIAGEVEREGERTSRVFEGDTWDRTSLRTLASVPAVPVSPLSIGS